ncbi:hypothetical protein L6Q96_16900 [Candidatus Binatia bacterium]|nr:hypothetical protein [Candidatus Binatia bacterium]
MRQGALGLTVRGQQWQATVREWERSGLAMREFCARRGLKAATLSWWRQQIKRLAERQARPERVELVEIGRREASHDRATFEVEVPSGVRVRVPMRAVPH